MRWFLREYLESNILEYLKLIIILAITVIVAILVVNNSSSEKEEIKSFIDSKIDVIKLSSDVERGTLFRKTLDSKLKEYFVVAFLASSVVGLPFAYLIIVRRIFSIGYSISAVFATQSIRTSIIFICNSLLFHNIIYMISLFLVLVAGINFVKLMLRRDKINLKHEIIKFLIFVLLGCALITISSLVQAYVFANCLNLLKKYL